MKKPSSKNNLSIFHRWLSDNRTWIGIFEDKALDSSTCGSRIAMAFDLSSESTPIIGQTRAPDTLTHTGWRYVLIAKCHTAEEALAVLEGADWPLIEQSQIKQSDDKV